MDEFERPDLSNMTTDDLCGLMLACGLSDDKSDKAFAKACRDEIAKRKPEKTANAGVKAAAEGSPATEGSEP